ncbi:uncharacterized protein LOC118433966 [Folsomia candida]|uniref:uncharacterized protein LOC118433966 n=1 Tax=Folsomia candida TaxID=158441 RepID=UPI0016055E5E|nr:uncharacterized protein LOC118433966 [Folsomia candida]
MDFASIKPTWMKPTKNTSHTEDLLLSVGNLPIRGLQIIGYLPLSVVQVPVIINNDDNHPPKTLPLKSLQFRWTGIPFLSQIFTLTFLAVFVTYFFKHSQDQESLYQLTSLTSDSIIIGILCTSCLTNCIVNRVHALACVRQTLRFWRFQCNQVGKIANLWNVPELVEDLRKQNRNIFFKISILLVLPLVFIAIDALWGVGIQDAQNGMIITPVAVVLMVSGGIFWIYLAYTNVLLNNWLTFFVRIYTTVLTGILREVDQHSALESLFVNAGAESIGSFNDASDAYDILIKLVDGFNDSFGIRILVEVGVYIVWILGCTYFAMVAWKVGRLCTCATNISASILAMYALYNYGNHGELLSQKRILLMKKLSQIRTQNLGRMECEEVKSLLRKVKNCDLNITAGHFFVLHRTFVLSILSVLMTLLIVMTQFRDKDETQKYGVRNNFNFSF